MPLYSSGPCVNGLSTALWWNLRPNPQVETHVWYGKSGQEPMFMDVTGPIKEVSVWGG